MNRIIGVALLVAGVVLLVLGMNASDSLSSDFSRFFTGSPTDKTIWLLIAGLVSSVLGLICTLRGTHTG